MWPGDEAHDRSKKLKKIIRQRARKTGERYTAARRQVLLARDRRGRRRRPKAPRTTASPAASTASGGKTRGSVSAANAVKQTGKSLDHWFAVLDAFGATAKGHTAAARHLSSEHGVPGWHAQGITVAYERARGVRVMNQSCDGTFQVGVSRVVARVDVADVIRALTVKAERSAWLRGADPRLARALDAAFEGPKARAVKVKDARNAHLRYPWDRTTVELRITGKPAGGASVSVGNINLSGPGEVESRRAAWKAALDGLKQHLEPLTDGGAGRACARSLTRTVGPAPPPVRRRAPARARGASACGRGRPRSR